MIGKTTRIAIQVCPNCKRPMNAVSSVQGWISPEPGSLTVCLHCRAVLEFKDDMTLMEADLNTLPIEVLQDILRMQQVCEQVTRMGN